METGIKTKVEEIRGYLLDYQRVIDDNYSLFENLRDLLLMEKNIGGCSSYHGVVYDIYNAIFSFYVEPLYETQMFIDNDTDKVVAKRIFWIDTSKEEYIDKDLFTQYYNGDIKHTSVRFVSLSATRFNHLKYDYSSRGKLSLRDYLYSSIISKGQDSYISSTVDSIFNNQSKITTIGGAQNKIEQTLSKIDSLYSELDFISKDLTYDQFVDKYKQVVEPVSNDNQSSHNCIIKYENIQVVHDKLVEQNYITTNLYSFRMLCMEKKLDSPTTIDWIRTPPYRKDLKSWGALINLISIMFGLSYEPKSDGRKRIIEISKTYFNESLKSSYFQNCKDAGKNEIETIVKASL